MVDQDGFDSQLKADRFALPRNMRAVQVGAFGGIEQLHLSSISVPTPRKGEVLVRVGAAGVGPWDALIREGRSGLAVTLPVTLGADLSGVVVEVGDGVEDLEPGDAVFGVTNDRFVGAYAEFALADASRLARKPVGLGFIEAGGMPVVAVTASMADCKVANVSLSTALPEPSAISSFSLLMVQA